MRDQADWGFGAKKAVNRHRFVLLDAGRWWRAFRWAMGGTVKRGRGQGPSGQKRKAGLRESTRDWARHNNHVLLATRSNTAKRGLLPDASFPK